MHHCQLSTIQVSDNKKYLLGLASGTASALEKQQFPEKLLLANYEKVSNHSASISFPLEAFVIGNKNKFLGTKSKSFNLKLQNLQQQ